ncbi:TPA: hypothetical protein DEP96_03565 [Candidatus Uhrbacteria bacterium]|nr:hypothetical protein [Candidatus Uhrbacteria bacterium]
MLESITSLRQAKPLAYVFAAVTAAFVFFLMTSSAFAAAPTFTTTVADNTSDGTIDTMVITFSENVTVKDTSDADGFANLTLGGGTTCSISNFAYGDGVSSVATVNILLGGCNAGNTALAPTLTYTGVASCATEGAICAFAGPNDQVAANTITTSPAVVATDLALPVLMSVAAGTTALSGLTYNSIAFTYSEPMQISSNSGGSWATTGTVVSSTTLGAMTTARTVAGLSSFNGTSDVTNAAATDNSVGVSTTTITVYFNAQATGYFSVAGTAPVGDNYTFIVSATAVKDIAGNAVNASGPARDASTVAWDITKPTVSNTYSCDADHNGTVEEMQINFSEAVLDAYLNTNVASFELDNDTSNSGTGEEAAAAFNTSTNGCDGSAADTDANDDKVRVDATTGIAGTETAYLNVTAAAIRDVAGNRIVAADNTGTEADKAAPILMSTSPLNAAVSVSKTAVVTMTFSEIVASMTFSIVGQSTADYTKNTTAAAVTLTPIGAMAGGYHAITVLTAPDAATNAYYGVTGAAVNPFHFTVISSSNVDDVATPASYTMLVTAPNGGENLVGGATQNITWSSSQTNSSAMNNVNISYTTDAGLTYTTIANNEANDGTYSWTVPSIDAAMVFVKVVGTDLVSELASDSSDSEFSIAVSATATPDETVTAPSTGTTGVSPLTGEEENISVVAYGDYIKGAGYDTVYFVDWASDGVTLVRRPFNDSQTYFTYQSNFSVLSTVTDATLPTMSLGSPMMPKPGVVLVKITTVNKVYAIGTSGELRWVTSEELASSIYGSNWSDYVIDIPDTLYPRFMHGTDITTDENIDVSGMKTRAEVNS